jgi:antibiotic biosynthesis monooxygenase (ABM) superfamily enzyme
VTNEHEQSLNVVVSRRIRTGREADFEEAMVAFAAWAACQPGQAGMQLLRPPPGSRDYIVAARFRDEAARRAFTASDDYREWMAKLGAMTEGETHIEELSGLEGWFTLPGFRDSARLPRWKMAVATFCGVLPTSIVLGKVLSPVILDWPYLVGQAAFAASMVALLTWVVMPLITRVLHGWLHRETRAD